MLGCGCRVFLWELASLCVMTRWRKIWEKTTLEKVNSKYQSTPRLSVSFWELVAL